MKIALINYLFLYSLLLGFAHLNVILDHFTSRFFLLFDDTNHCSFLRQYLILNGHGYILSPLKTLQLLMCRHLEQWQRLCHIERLMGEFL